MTHIAEWSVRVFVFDHEDSVAARAELSTGSTTLTGRGSARWIPGEPNVPEVGEEVAISRALVDLAGHLMTAAKADVESLIGIGVLEKWRVDPSLVSKPTTPPSGSPSHS
jgi:hypothetical protein